MQGTNIAVTVREHLTALPRISHAELQLYMLTQDSQLNSLSHGQMLNYSSAPL